MKSGCVTGMCQQKWDRKLGRRLESTAEGEPLQGYTNMASTFDSHLLECEIHRPFTMQNDGLKFRKPCNHIIWEMI